MRAAWCIFAAVILLRAQTPSQAKFELASVRVVSVFSQGFPARRVVGGPGTQAAARVEYREFSLKDILFLAYRVPFFQMPTPSWMNDTFFTIQAQVPPGAPKEELPLMLQHLLQERFKLKIRRQSEEIGGYALTIAKNGVRLQPSPELPRDVSASPDIGPRLEADKDGFYILPPGTSQMLGRSAGKDGLSRVTAARASMTLLSSYLARQLQQPVVDQTGLSGVYDFRFAFVPDMASPESPTPAPNIAGSDIPGAPDPVPTIHKAVELQLGLKLQPKKIRIDKLVIDHIERTPVDN